MLELNSWVSSDSTHTLQVISKSCADLRANSWKARQHGAVSAPSINWDFRVPRWCTVSSSIGSRALNLGHGNIWSSPLSSQAHESKADSSNVLSSGSVLGEGAALQSSTPQPCSWNYTKPTQLELHTPTQPPHPPWRFRIQPKHTRIIPNSSQLCDLCPEHQRDTCWHPHEALL